MKTVLMLWDFGVRSLRLQRCHRQSRDDTACERRIPAAERSEFHVLSPADSAAFVAEKHVTPATIVRSEGTIACLSKI
jgi:hypothetical protein